MTDRLDYVPRSLEGLGELRERAISDANYPLAAGLTWARDEIRRLRQELDEAVESPDFAFNLGDSVTARHAEDYDRERWASEQQKLRAYETTGATR